MSTGTSDKAARPSEWQQRIEGEWYGIPSIFDAQGNHVGYDKVSRSSVFENGKTTYTMNTGLDVTGPLRARFEAKDFSFGVIDSDRDRIYLGPDFVGAGQPWGALVDAHYYSPGWMADLRTMVHVLPDGKTQAYSSMLYEGPTVVAVFNGLYKVASDYGKNPETTRFIDGFLETERQKGKTPHILPFKKSGQWTGELTAYGPGQQPSGTAQVKIAYRPLTLLRAEVEVSVSGPFERRFRFERSRNGNRHTFDGPDVYGNGIAYGRALYTSQHFFGTALKIKGREFLLDDGYTMSVVWQVYGSDQVQHVLFGCLRWEEGDDVLKARYSA
jgi:hypothetical protein